MFCSKLFSTGVHLSTAISIAITQIHVTNVSYLKTVISSVLVLPLYRHTLHAVARMSSCFINTFHWSLFLSVLLDISRLASPVPSLGCMRQKENPGSSLLCPCTPARRGFQPASRSQLRPASCAGLRVIAPLEHPVRGCFDRKGSCDDGEVCSPPPPLSPSNRFTLALWPPYPFIRRSAWSQSARVLSSPQLRGLLA